MDSHQLLTALHEAQNKAGRQPCLVTIKGRRSKAATEPLGAIYVSDEAAPPSRSTNIYHKPTITITHITSL